MNSLRAGTRVRELKILKVIGSGGFGITYLAEHLDLRQKVALKEHYPEVFASRKGKTITPHSHSKGDFEWSRDQFLTEARTLARLDHPNIVKVSNIFEENNTAYMVLEFVDGQTLKGLIKELGRPPTQEELDSLMTPLLSALEQLHDGKTLHRDIAPDNIIVTPEGKPVLIDFGSARQAVGGRTKTMTAVVKEGYSPVEQYAAKGQKQGPPNDIYALGATAYWALTGKPPPESVSRVTEDTYVPATDAATGAYRAGFLSALDHALEVFAPDRPQSIKEWRDELFTDGSRVRRTPPSRTQRGGAKTMTADAISYPASKANLIWGTGIAAMLILLVGGGYMAWRQMLPGPERIPPETTAEVQQTATARATQLDDTARALPHKPLPRDITIDQDVLKLIGTHPFFADAPSVKNVSYREYWKSDDSGESNTRSRITWLQQGIIYSESDTVYLQRGIRTKSHSLGLSAANGLIELGTKSSHSSRNSNSNSERILENIDNLEGRIFPLKIGNRFTYRTNVQEVGYGQTYNISSMNKCEVVDMLDANLFNEALGGSAYLVDCRVDIVSSNNFRDSSRLKVVFFNELGTWMTVDPKNPKRRLIDPKSYTALENISIDGAAGDIKASLQR